MRIGIIFGGRSGEHEVSLMSARSVLSAIDYSKYIVTEIGITHTGEWFSGEGVLDGFEEGNLDDLIKVFLSTDPSQSGLYRIAKERSNDEGSINKVTDIDVFFPVLHGSYGEDGTIQGLFEMINTAYSGAGVVGSSVGMDKDIFKSVMRSKGLPVLDWKLIRKSEISTRIEEIIEEIGKLLNYPMFTKPANMGSSVGISKCSNSLELKEGLIEAARYDRRILVEQGINAREIEVSVLGNDDPMASLPGEIRPADEFYSYNAKYYDDRSELIIPARLSLKETEVVQQIALEAYEAIDCAGMARVDFLKDKDSGKLYINELNTIPGFTQISMYPKLWEVSGLSYPDLINRLIELAIERKDEMNTLERVYKRTA